ncbi:hypothetical protein Mapa_012073 [Marchantia paleacea]|nr:hypothetical protein Mapa_012073 [Marchantia paleacea]
MENWVASIRRRFSSMRAWMGKLKSRANQGQASREGESSSFLSRLHTRWTDADCVRSSFRVDEIRLWLHILVCSVSDLRFLDTLIPLQNLPHEFRQEFDAFRVQVQKCQCIDAGFLSIECVTCSVFTLE